MQSTSEVQKVAPLFQDVPIERIDFSPYQIRGDIDDAGLRELAVSIQQNGLAQPIVVRPIGERFQLVVGERRTRAAQLVGWTSIPAIVKELSDVDAALLVLVEDQQRQDANPLERARGYQRLMEKFGLDQSAIARRLGVDRSMVNRLVSLLQEPAEIQALLAQDKLSVTHLRPLDAIKDPEKRIEMASEAADKSWSVKETERRVNSVLNPRASKSKDGLLAQAEAHVPWEWLRDAIHFVRSISALRRAGKATLRFMRSVTNLRAVKSARYFLAYFMPMRQAKLDGTERLEQLEARARRELPSGEAPRSDDARPPPAA